MATKSKAEPKVDEEEAAVLLGQKHLNDAFIQLVEERNALEATIKKITIAFLKEIKYLKAIRENIEL